MGSALLRALGLGSLFILFAQFAYGDDVELRRYYRCYERLTGKPVPYADRSNPMLTSIKTAASGSTAAKDACAALLNGAALASTNLSGDPRVIKKLHEVARGFIATPEYFNAIQKQAIPHLIDTYEIANAFTYFTLKPGADFSTILTGNQTFTAMRTLTSAPIYQLLSPFTAFSAHGPGNTTLTTVSYIQQGDLLGIVPAVPNATLYPDSSGKLDRDLPASTVGTSNTATRDMNAPTGAGLFGTQSYLISADVNQGMLQNGTTLLRRRLMRNIYQDFFCKSLPVVLSSDYPDITPISSATYPDASAYRFSSTCLQCHVSMDRGAAIFRNLISVKSGGPDDLGSIQFVANRSAGSFAPDQGGTDLSFPKVPDPLFYTRAPKGKLFFRSYDSNRTLIDLDINGIGALGTAIAAQDDFYACVASKYYKYFTGISVNLENLEVRAQANPTAASLNPDQIYHRNQVIALGQNLKTSKSLKSLILEIINSQAFIRPDWGAP